MYFLSVELFLIIFWFSSQTCSFESVIYASSEKKSEDVGETKKKVVVIPYFNCTPVEDEEDQLNYIRLDPRLNLFHKIFHESMYSPSMANRSCKRGELFYYMHQQAVARYNIERISVKLPLVQPLTNFKKPIKERFKPRPNGLTRDSYSERPPNCVLKDVKRPGENIEIDKIDLSRQRVLQAIQDDCVISQNGEKIPLDPKDAIDTLTNMMESNYLSPNAPYYGNFHNDIHMALSACPDPLFEKSKPLSVIGFLGTSVMDPCFYRIHQEITRVLQTYLNKMPSYSKHELAFPGVKLEEVDVFVDNKNKNTLYTYLQESEINFKQGLDYDSSEENLIRYIHLDHKPFTIKIKVKNDGKETNATVRIFLGPKFNQEGVRYLFNDQRALFVELDRFPVKLQHGENTIERMSENSTVTVLPEQQEKEDTGDSPTHTGCGYPHNLHIPRGTARGMPVQLCVIISDWEGDKVEGVDLMAVGNLKAVSMCGVKNMKFPYKRAAGFPFDRQAHNVSLLEQFLTTNMFVRDITIIHDSTLPSPCYVPVENITTIYA